MECLIPLSALLEISLNNFTHGTFSRSLSPWNILSSSETIWCLYSFAKKPPKSSQLHMSMIPYNDVIIIEKSLYQQIDLTSNTTRRFSAISTKQSLWRVLRVFCYLQFESARTSSHENNVATIFVTLWVHATPGIHR